jgi:FtsH-binding integral membrane protein
MYKNILKLNYWTNTRPGSLDPTMQKYFIGFIVILAVFVVISAYLDRVKKGSYSKIWRRLHSFAITNFVISLILLFFTYEAIPFLSSRFWFIIWTLIMVFWLKLILKHSKEIPKLRENRKKEEEYQKYLP